MTLSKFCFRNLTPERHGEWIRVGGKAKSFPGETWTSLENGGVGGGVRGILGEMTDLWLKHHSECHTHALKGCSSVPSQGINKHILG